MRISSGVMRRAFVAAALSVALLAEGACAARITGNQVIESVRKTYAAVHDYRVDANLSISAPNLKLSGMAMTIYYKKPDKVHVDWKNCPALIPQGLFAGNLVDWLGDGYRAVYLRSEKKVGRYCRVVRLTAPDRPRVTIWVDSKLHVIIAIQTVGSFNSSSIWSYKMVGGKHWLPVRVSASMVMPGESKQANAIISFSNYAVNKGINDKVFSE